MTLKAEQRRCDGCTKCCEGWLSGVAHGQAFWPGRPCAFMKKNGCEIYKDRPEDPCKSFRCAWLNGDLPAWMKPSDVNMIAVWRRAGEHPYLDVSEAGSPLEARIISWLMMEFAAGRIRNVRWQLNGGVNYVGSKEFVEALNGTNK